MDRRRLLTTLAAGGIGGLAGCSFFSRSRDQDNVTPIEASSGPGTGSLGEGSPPETATTTETGEKQPLGRRGIPGDICEREAEGALGIYAVTEPAFDIDWTGRTINASYRLQGYEGLAPEQTVIGLRGPDTVKAYPITVLWEHEVLNDNIGGSANEGTGPVIVTYCPLCRSGLVASRVIDGTSTLFKISGLLWQAPGSQEATAEEEGRVFGAERAGGEEIPVRHNRNLVMFDEITGSYWSQILARAICGPKERQFLSIAPFTATTWSEWRAEHPDTQVLLPPPYSKTTNPNGEVTTEHDTNSDSNSS